MAGLEVELEAIQALKVPFKTKWTGPRFDFHVIDSLVSIANILFGHEYKSQPGIFLDFGSCDWCWKLSRQFLLIWVLFAGLNRGKGFPLHLDVHCKVSLCF